MQDWTEAQLSPQEGEAQALLFAMKWVKQLSIQRVILETDCKSVVDQTYSQHNSITEGGVLIQKIRNTLKADVDYRVSFVSRKCYMAADAMARSSIENPVSHIFQFIPTNVNQIIEMEIY